MLYSLLCFLLWFRLCCFVVFARFGARFLRLIRVWGWYSCQFYIERFVCVDFVCFHGFLVLNYVLQCCVSAGILKACLCVVVCSLFAVPFTFLLALFLFILWGDLTLTTCRLLCTRDSTNHPWPSSPNLVFWLSFGCMDMYPRPAMVSNNTPCLLSLP